MRGYQIKPAFGGFWEECQAVSDDMLPEHKLILAIITRAMLDYINPGFGGKRRKSKIRALTRIFLFEEGFDEEEWSFFWLLNHITNDPDGLRRKIRTFCVKNEDQDTIKNQFLGYKVARTKRKHPIFFRVK